MAKNKVIVQGSEGYIHQYSPTEVINKSLFGSNMGNMLFYGSVYNVAASNKDNIITSDISEESIRNADYYLMPQANLFYKYFKKNMENYIVKLKKLDTPTILVGVGYQSSVGEENIKENTELDDTVRKFISEILRHSVSIGVRGQITKKYVLSLGFAESDVDVIGDPSIRFFGKNFDTKIRQYKPFNPDMKIAVNYTPSRYDKKWGDFINSIFFNYSKSFAILQDTYEFYPLLWKYKDMKLPKVPDKVKSYDLPVSKNNTIHWQNRARFFTNPEKWFNSLGTFDFSVGTRIHGNIAAILAGTPALTIAIDTRTLELAEYFKIPYIKLADLNEETTLESLYIKATEEMPKFYENYDNVLKDYLRFFEKNNVPINRDFFE